MEEVYNSLEGNSIDTWEDFEERVIKDDIYTQEEFNKKQGEINMFKKLNLIL